MNKKKFVLLTSTDEPNIGVIAIDNPSKLITHEALDSAIGEKIITAVQEHFDVDSVTILKLNFQSDIPITASVIIQIGNEFDDGKYVLDIHIDETWVY